MASIKDLKKRIGSVKNTQQTTRAMKMVSAAKFRRAQDAVLQGRGYSIQLRKLAQEASKHIGEEYHSPLLLEGAGKAGVKKRLLVVVTSDRGLCGGFNSNIIRSVQKLLVESKDYELCFIGKRGYDFFRTKNVVIGKYYSELGSKYDAGKVRNVARDLTQKFLSGNYASIEVVYNEFKNAALQLVSQTTLLPIRADSVISAKKANRLEVGSTTADGFPKFYPSTKALMDGVLEKLVPAYVARIVLESLAGEHGARMSAMENATKNAGEMIKKLTLQFNKQRQAGITKELLEIISGSESAKG